MSIFPVYVVLVITVSVILPVEIESVYEHLSDCNHMAQHSSTPIDDLPALSSMIMDSTISPTLTQSVEYTFCPSTSDNEGHLGFATWHYIIIGLCAALGLLSCLQAAIIFYQCYWRYMWQDDSRNHPVVISDKTANESYTNTESSPSSLPPHFIGTYSYIQPSEDDRTPNKNVYSIELKKDTPTSVETSCTHSCSQVEPLATLEDSSSISLPILSPGAHIYQTLDKYLDQPDHDDQSPVKESDNVQLRMDETNKSHKSYDRLFDDPNYSRVEIDNSHTPTPLVSSSTPNIPCSQDCSFMCPEKYDKLQPKTSEAEYAYAYSHMLKLRKHLKKLKRKEPSSSSHHQVELLHVAAMGTYEMDPSFVSTLERDISTKRSDGSAKKSKTSSRENKGGVGGTPHQYQSLNKTTMTSESGYTDLVK